MGLSDLFLSRSKSNEMSNISIIIIIKTYLEHRFHSYEFYRSILLEEGFAGVKKTLNMSYASCSPLLVSNTTYIEPIHMHIRKAEIELVSSL